MRSALLSRRAVLPCLFLAALLAACSQVYWPGVTGGFLFDDFPNLETLGTYGGVTDWLTLKAYVSSGFSGPTGRPLSLLSFLLDDNTWPSSAAWFKRTNVLLHLVTGLTLIWASLLLFRLHRMEERQAQYLAVFSSACWLLHPLMVSTTLYVVQRMALLSTLFVLAGIAGYLYGRSLLLSRRRYAYIWMSCSMAGFGLLAILSKENGALLPLLVLTIELCLPDESKVGGRAPCFYWSSTFLYLPSAALFVYLLSFIDFSPDAWPARSFTQPERLLSEARIIWEYLGHLYIPQIEGRGLFQDGYRISHDLLTPWTTLPSVLGVIALLCAALVLRRRLPLFATAVLFFAAAHVLESSVVGLELYFEHRNYLAAVFLFVPVGVGINYLKSRFSVGLASASAVLIVIVLGFMTYQRVQLWRDSNQLELYWANSNPDSPRAQNAVAAYLMRAGRTEEADLFLSNAARRLPNSSLLNMRILLQKVYAGSAREKDFEETADRLREQSFDAQAVVALRTLVDRVLLRDVPIYYRSSTYSLIEKLESVSAFTKIPVFFRLAPYLKGRLDLSLRREGSACGNFEQAIKRYSSVEPALMMVAEAASAGYPHCAKSLLDVSVSVLRLQNSRSLPRTRAEYEKEINYLDALIRRDIAAMVSKESP